MENGEWRMENEESNATFCILHAPLRVAAKRYGLVAAKHAGAIAITALLNSQFSIRHVYLCSAAPPRAGEM